jgi:uncharacterized membrane protein
MMTPETGTDPKDPERKPVEQRRVKKLFSGVQSSFIAGVVVVAPIGITAGLIYWFVTGPMAKVDGFMKRAIPEWGHIDAYGKAIPGLGVLIAVLLIILIGAATKNLVGRTLVRTGERFLESVPVVRTLYKFFRNVFSTALQKSDRSFKEVALVPYPRKGLWALAFVVGDAKGEIKNAIAHEFSDPVSVFVPTVPNPTSGFLIYVSRAEMKTLKMSIEDAAKLVFSLGLVVPESEDADEAVRKLESMAAEAKAKKPAFTFGK